MMVVDGEDVEIAVRALKREVDEPVFLLVRVREGRALVLSEVVVNKLLADQEGSPTDVLGRAVEPK